MHVVNRLDGLVGGRALPRADGHTALRLLAPAALQLVERRVVLAPLAAGEEAPLQRVLQPVVRFAFAAAGVLGAGALDVDAIEDAEVPGAVVGALADLVIQLAPVVSRYLL